ncbi:MAG TPA: RsmB/NOP family class I SAM-dependent RNA methyltransferase [Streptosporangiaceae bacterium]|nr:RsmB/NOP family class I SAM-dependent RNA methyltransferase [Streptosporangiaceae bacterium]
MSRDAGRRAGGAGRRVVPAAAGRGQRGGSGRRQAGSAGQGHGPAGRTAEGGQDGAGRGPDRARRTAHAVLLAVSERDAYANLLLAAALRDRGLRGQDAALATELVYGTLRNRSCYDAVIGLCADRELSRIDPPVLEVLRLGAHQLLGMRIKAHAAVATTVDLAIGVIGRRPAGFVNAVLRRIAPRELESWLELVAPDRSADPVGHLSVRYSHPRWIVTAFADALGETVPSQHGAPEGAPDGAGDVGPARPALAETEAALAADQQRPAITLAAVPGLAEPAELTGAGAQPARWSPFGAYLPGGDPGALPAVAENRASVQDEASQLAVLALTRAETGGEDRAWLDLCAGPGGKARLLAGLAAERGAVVVAADVHEHRARLTAQAIRESGAGRAVIADGTAPAWRHAAFDRVLADVPCSGLGSLRRRPEARWRRGPADIAALGELQRALLVSAIEATRPGGVLAYVTCSPHLAETRDVLGDVLASRGDLEVLDCPALLAGIDRLRCREPDSRYAQFWPHRHGTDAIFIALLRRARQDQGAG